MADDVQKLVVEQDEKQTSLSVKCPECGLDVKGKTLPLPGAPRSYVCPACQIGISVSPEAALPMPSDGHGSDPDFSRTPLAECLQEEEEAMLNKIREWIDEDPLRRAAWQAWSKEQTQADAAEAANISVPTLRKHILALKDDLLRSKPFFS